MHPGQKRLAHMGKVQSGKYPKIQLDGTLTLNSTQNATWQNLLKVDFYRKYLIYIIPLFFLFHLKANMFSVHGVHKAPVLLINGQVQLHIQRLYAKTCSVATMAAEARNGLVLFYGLQQSSRSNAEAETTPTRGFVVTYYPLSH